MGRGKTKAVVDFGSFNGAMHYSAKRGIAIACRPSVCLSVCDVGGSGRFVQVVQVGSLGNYLHGQLAQKSTPSLFVAQRPSTYSHGNMGKF